MSASSSKISLKLCELCNENASTYCCPRCEVFYCSLECYKSEAHLACSEDFYRDCVNEELTSQHIDDDSKQKMIEILKKMKDKLDDLDENLESTEEVEEIDSDDNDDLELQERIKNLDLNDADAVWDALTEDERNEFVALVSQGDISQILPQWEPWWTYNNDDKLVKDVNDKEEELALKRCPEIIKVPKFCELTTVQPSPSIQYNIVNVLASYAFVLRYFNGEIDPVETVAYLINICRNLDANVNYDDAPTAVECVKQQCLQSELIETDEDSIEVMKRDTFFLLQGPSEDHRLLYCKAALSHIHKIITEAKSTLKSNKQIKKESDDVPNDSKKQAESGNKRLFTRKFPDQKGDYLPVVDVSKLKKCLKKVEFYLSFVECHGMDFE